MEIGWTDVGSGGYILVSCVHSQGLNNFPNVHWSRTREHQESTGPEFFSTGPEYRNRGNKINLPL